MTDKIRIPVKNASHSEIMVYIYKQLCNVRLFLFFLTKNVYGYFKYYTLRVIHDVLFELNLFYFFL